MLQYGMRASIFNIEPGWAEQVELKGNFTKNLFRSGQISVCRAFMVKFRSNDVELGKVPISLVKFIGKLNNSAK
jgi:hypothetical protein